MGQDSKPQDNSWYKVWFTPFNILFVIPPAILTYLSTITESYQEMSQFFLAHLPLLVSLLILGTTLTIAIIRTILINRKRRVNEAIKGLALLAQRYYNINNQRHLLVTDHVQKSKALEKNLTEAKNHLSQTDPRNSRAFSELLKNYVNDHSSLVAKLSVDLEKKNSEEKSCNEIVDRLLRDFG